MPTTFYSDSVASALATARLTLGDDTVLVEAGSTPPEQAGRGPYRVVVAGPEERPAPGAGQAKARPPAPPQQDSSGGLRQELRALRSSLDALGAMAARTALGHSALAQAPELAPWIGKLLEMDVPPDLIQAAAEGASRRLRLESAVPGTIPQPAVRRAIVSEIEGKLLVQPGLGREGEKCRVAALAGPPGAGKTTTLAKLAMREGVSGRHSAVLLSVDVFRIGAADQLRNLASILGIPFRLCETPAALRRALVEARQRDLVLIDTPGASPAESEWWQEWVPRLAAERAIEIQLVLPATASPKQLAAWVERYAALDPGRLIFTHLDEAESFGGLLAAVLKAQRPVSFLASGQGIPEDLEQAAKPRLLELLLGGAGVLSAAA